MNYKVINNQSLLDIACEIAGNVDAVFDLIKENDFVFNLDFATEPAVNDLVKIPSSFTNFTKQIADYFTATKRNIATAENGKLIDAGFSLGFNLGFNS